MACAMVVEQIIKDSSNENGNAIPKIPLNQATLGKKNNAVKQEASSGTLKIKTERGPSQSTAP